MSNWTPVTLLLVAVVFGGGFTGVGDVVVYGATSIAAGVLSWCGRPRASGFSTKAMDLVVLGALGLCLLQLVPLPVMLTMSDGARGAILAELNSAGLSPAWSSISLDLWASLRATLAAFVFAAIWWAMRLASVVSRINTIKAAIVVAVLMALLATWQSMAKPDTTGGEALFSNRNHLATLLTMLLPFALAAAHSGVKSRPLWRVAAWYSAAGMLLVGIASTLSRAGAMLAVFALLASLIFIVWPNFRGRRWRLLVGALVTAALTAAATITAGKLQERFSTGFSGDLRWNYYMRSWQVLQDYFPWGSGVGTFAAVLERGEAVNSLLSPVWGPGEYIFALYAHNEPLQVGIEAGLPGMLLAAALVAIVASVIFAMLWRIGKSSPWRRAAAISVPVPLLHSLVDSPLRTLACLALFAAAMVILLVKEPRPDSREGRSVA